MSKQAILFNPASILMGRPFTHCSINPHGQGIGRQNPAVVILVDSTRRHALELTKPEPVFCRGRKNPYVYSET
jgi:hypothetical protein